MTNVPTFLGGDAVQRLTKITPQGVIQPETSTRSPVTTELHNVAFMSVELQYI